jgi:hypothetical protein
MIWQERDRLRKRAWRAKRKAEGLCINCGAPAWRKGAALCEKHLTKVRENNKRQKMTRMRVREEMIRLYGPPPKA